MANKISRTLGILNKLKHVLPIYTLKTMYSALIVPHFNYNILLWGFNSKRISTLQKKAIRIITCGKYNSHTEPMFKRLNLLRIDDIFTCQCMSFYHKYVNNNVPLFCKSLFTCNATHQFHVYQTRHNMHLVFLTAILHVRERVSDTTFLLC